MVATLTEKQDLLAATAVFVIAAPIAYFGYRGRLDTFTLRINDISPLYWFFRWRYRHQLRSAADTAFLRFFWRMNIVLLAPYVLILVWNALDLLVLRHG